MGEKKKHNFRKKILKKYQLVLFDEQSLLEIWSSKINRFKVYGFAFIYTLIVVILVSLIFIFTPINRLLPAYANSEMQNEIIRNAMLADSLEQQIMIRDKYFKNIKKIIEGKTPEEIQEFNNAGINSPEIELIRTKHDSIIQRQIEEEELFNLAITNDKNKHIDLSNIHFFIPVKGIVTNKFNPETKHFGVDIVSSPNEPILATLSGTVIASTWTINTGFVIEIQHDNNIVSFYKHNSALLKQVGDIVTAGETIAIIGNTGELSTGPHLHFELWYNGTPLNPEDYIVF
jgi:murein DD-endopeptidase MepM/ murein hydrolase activator NlpD